MATHPDQGRLLKGLGGDEPIKPDFGQATLHAEIVYCCAAMAFGNIFHLKKC